MCVFLFWIEVPKSSPQPAPASIFTSNWQFFCFEMPHSAFRFTSTSTPIPLWIYPFESLKPKVTNRTPTLLFFQLSEAPTPQRHSNCGPQKPFWHWMNETDIDFRWGFPVECSGGHKINTFPKCKHMSMQNLQNLHIATSHQLEGHLTKGSNFNIQERNLEILVSYFQMSAAKSNFYKRLARSAGNLLWIYPTRSADPLDPFGRQATLHCNALYCREKEKGLIYIY